MSLWRRVLAQLGTYVRPVGAKAIAAGMVGTVDPKEVQEMLAALEQDGMAGGYQNLYVLTESGRRYLDEATSPDHDRPAGGV